MLNQIVSNSIPGIPAWISIINNAGMEKGFFCPNHFHDEIELLFVLTGKKRFVINDKIIDLNKGEGIFVNRRIPHITETMEDGTIDVLLQINIESLMLSEQSRINKYLTLIFSEHEKEYLIFKKNTKAHDEILSCILKISEEYKNGKNAYSTYIKGELYHIVGCLIRNGIIKESGFTQIKDNMDKIKDVFFYIEKNYAKQITLEELSKVVNMNSSYFCRYFKKLTGKTIMEYINFVRICKAEDFLAQTSDSVIEISMEVGFSSASYFNRVFKNINGISPTEYRKIKHY